MSYRGRSCEISWVPTHSIPEADQSNKLRSFGTSESLLSGEMDEHKHSGGPKMICHDFVTDASNVNYLTIQNVLGPWCAAACSVLQRWKLRARALTFLIKVINLVAEPPYAVLSSNPSAARTLFAASFPDRTQSGTPMPL
jgi:hypothetical protein